MTLNVIQMTEEAYQQRLEEAATLGAIKALERAGVQKKEYFTRSELVRKYSREVTDRVIREGKLIPSVIKGKTRPVFLLEDVVKAFPII